MAGYLYDGQRRGSDLLIDDKRLAHGAVITAVVRVASGLK